MDSRKSKIVILALVVLLGALSGPAAAQIRCLPSCAPDDGRFLAIAGSNLITLSDTELDLTISVPADATSFQLGIFDGDARGLDGLLVPHWDTGTLPATYEYTLYTDPAANGTGSTIVEMVPGFPSLLSLTMPDNDWIDFTIPTSPDASTPSGNYFYRLNIRLLTPALTIVNAFKVRTSAVVSGVTLDPTEQPFSYIANATSLADIAIVYPSYPSLTPTNYDGSFTFFFDVPVTQQSLTVWDGDYDRGKFDGTQLDTNDPDTPGAPFLPAWATEDAVSEGATGAPGNPADDRSPAATGIYLLKEPSVQYSLIFPDGQTFFNPNPSGNQEWEQFRISTDPFDPSLMDYSTASIPPGIYELKAEGVDMQNLNALLLPFRFLCVDAENVPCEPLRPYLVGDTVFLDTDGDGNQGPGEPGRAGVVVNLVDDNGALLDTTTTDADGHYSFEVEAYSYTVEVAAENFEPGGALEGYVSTTGNDRTDTVIDDNVLTYDFGYQGTGSIGGRLWNDLDGDGVQNAGEPSFNGLTLQLLDENGTVIATTTTSGDGNYLFSHLGPGDYTLRVVSATQLAGFVPTYDPNGIGTPGTTTVSLAPGENLTDMDFGYRVPPASVGDRIWNDLDGDGSQDMGETGLNGVTVELLDASAAVIATTTTSGDGNYTFSNVTPGSYTVRVASATLPAGFTATYDLDGTGTPHTTALSLASGQNRTDVDFGYRATPGLIGDRVWNDADGDGVQDSGEAGLNGVTVQLVDGGGTVIATAVTSGNGNYLFNNVTPGTYNVRVVAATLPSGYAATYDLDGTATANTATVSLAPGASLTNVDFGYRSTVGSIGDRVWNDLDGDGVQDAGEPGLNGVTVQLVNSSGTVVATQVTSGNGNYLFTNVAPGTYTVRVVSSTLPANYGPTYDLDGTGTAHTATVTLAPNGSLTHVDFGYRCLKPSNPGTGTIGYWKNHPEAWPVQQITVGGVTYTKSQAISLMGAAGKGDKTYDLFKQLVAAKLNVLIGNYSSCINTTITNADNWLKTYKLGSRVSSSSTAWQTGGPLHQKLDDYNNGRLCAPHRG